MTSREPLAVQLGALLRRARGATPRRALARKAGVSNTALHDIETGLDNPTLARVEELARLYNIKVRLVADRPGEL